jgi:uncharacterized Zn-binding protein involved in type VI secretion
MACRVPAVRVTDSGAARVTDDGSTRIASLGSAVQRLGDMCSGHDCWPPRSNIEASGNVFCNGIAVHRQGDAWEPHTCGSNTHDGALESGSGSVFVNGRQIGRAGDPISCGSVAVPGSPNVFAGG